MHLSMDLWHSNNRKVILCKFAKDHCFWTLWTLNYVAIVFLFLYWFFPYCSSEIILKKILFSNLQKTWSNLHLCGRGSIKSVPFICSSTCLFVRLWCIFLSIYTVDFLISFFIAWGYFAIYTKKVLIQILENCICYLDNWLNKTNLDQKQKMLHFYESSITFCALNGALNDFVKTACLWKIWFLRYRPKYSPPIRLQDFSNFDTSKTVWGIMLILCM